MEFKWTAEQAAAVEAPVSNILVTAAAGAGKTQALTGRIIRRILAGADISRLLVVTFTNAAAAEMRGRIAGALSDELLKNPRNAHVRQQIAMLSAARIMTIHSFCLDVIKNNCFRAGLSAGFRVADEAEAALLKADAADRALQKLYTEENESFLSFSDCFSRSRDDNNIIDMLLQLYEFADSMPYPSEWVKKQAQQYNVPTAEEFKQSKCARIILDFAKKTLREALGISEAALSLCTPEAGLEPYIKMLCDDMEVIRTVEEVSDDWSCLGKALATTAFCRRPSVKNADETVKQQVASMRDEVKKSISELTEILYYPAEACAETMQKAGGLYMGLCALYEAFEAEYTALKRARGLLDFGDIEHICIRLLDDGGAPSEVAREIKNELEEIYIDEYQDSNQAQEFIFSLISRESDGEPNIFMVGDIKQSIYGFRQTSPELFLEKKKTYGRNEKYRKILLSKNFRSNSSVIGFVNLMFEALMSEALGGVSYDGEERLMAGAPYPDSGKETEINLVDMSCEDEDDLSAIEAQGRLIARKIHDIVARDFVFDLKEGCYRQTRFSDIVVLLRSSAQSAPVIQAQLASAGIPAYADAGDGYFDAAEVKAVLALLSVIDNPLSDIPLISVLRSPICGFNEDELAEIRLCDKKGAFYGSLCKCAHTNSETGAKCRSFLDRLKKWRKRAEHDPCDELIEYLLDDTGYADFVSALPGGQMRTANLRLLFEKARIYEQSSFRGLFNFISFIDKVEKKGSDSGGAKLIGENHDVVRIMSIHKSKGLEFPIVILANAGKRFNRQDEQGKMLMHKDAGVGIECIDRQLRTACSTPAKAAVKIKKAEESLSEELRVLYVALTRAKERIIVVASVKSPDEERNKWSFLAKRLRKGGSFRASSYLDWIGTCACLCSSETVKIQVLGKGETGGCASLEEEHYEPEAVCDEGAEEKLSYKYPHESLWKIPSKVTVTEFKRLINTDFDSETFELFKPQKLKTPRFLEREGRLSAAERGSLVHFIMQTIDIGAKNLYDVHRHVEDLVRQNILTEEMARAVPCEKIAAFFDSDLGQRLKRADRVYREEPFTMLVPASSVTGRKGDFGEKILVQGIIDCFFFEGTSPVLLDFKTDKVTDTEEIKKAYETQMNLYASALEKKYFLKIYEKFIYLFDNNGIIYYD